MRKKILLILSLPSFQLLLIYLKLKHDYLINNKKKSRSILEYYKVINLLMKSIKINKNKKKDLYSSRLETKANLFKCLNEFKSFHSFFFNSNISTIHL